MAVIILLYIIAFALAPTVMFVLTALVIAAAALFAVFSISAGLLALVPERWLRPRGKRIVLAGENGEPEVWLGY
jgi:membrane protein implicated in regulation of membrane protease activity